MFTISYFLDNTKSPPATSEIILNCTASQSFGPGFTLNLLEADFLNYCRYNLSVCGHLYNLYTF